METSDVLTLLPYVAGAITAVIALVGVIAEKTKNETDDKIVQWARLIWSFIPIGQKDPAKMGKTGVEK